MKSRLSIYVCAAVFFIFAQCKNDPAKQTEPMPPASKTTLSIEKAPFGKTPDGENAAIYTLKNRRGMEVKITNYGGIITSWMAPDKNGSYQDIVLGYDSLDQYFRSSPYFGAIIGRYGNRIAKSKFSIDGMDYQLAANDGVNHLHGGLKGFDKVIWRASESRDSHSVSLKLSYLSKDMEEGYPGNLQTTVTYTLTDDNTLDVRYEATTDKTTIVNLTQHSYFNLSGDFNKPVLDHEIMINAAQYIPVDKTLIPTGELKEVAGTPFDFRTAKPTGRDIEAADDQLKNGLGYDHCWVLNEQDQKIRLAASAFHPESGRMLEVFTTEPGIQFYTGNFLDGTLPQKGGGTYAQRTGFCLETQHYPDSPNQPGFPSVLLKPGGMYVSETSFKFSVR